MHMVFSTHSNCILALALLVIVLLSAEEITATERPIRTINFTDDKLYIGVVTPYLTDPVLNQSVYENARDVTNSIKLWRNVTLGKYLDIPGVENPVSLEIKVYNSTSIADTVVQIKKLCNDPYVIAVVTSGDTNYGTPSMNNVYNCSKIIVATQGVSTSWYNQEFSDFTFQIPSLAENRFDPVLPYFRNSNITKIAIITADSAFVKSLGDGFTAEKAKANALEIVYRKVVPGNGDANRANYTATIKGLKASGGRGLLIGGSETTVRPLLEELQSLDCSVDLITVAPDRTAYFSWDPKLVNYMTLVTDNHPTISYTKVGAYDPFRSFQEFWDVYSNKFGIAPTIFVWHTVYAFLLVEQGLLNMVGTSESSCQCACDPNRSTNGTIYTLKNLRDAMQRLELDTIAGRIKFDGTNRPLITDVIVQVLNNKSFVVAPPLAQSQPFVIPVPSWSERVYDNSFSTAELGFTAFCLFCILVSLIFAGFVIVLKKNSVMEASLPEFLFLVLVGSMMVYIAVILWSYHALTDANCHAFVWLIALGFTLMFGCLFAKTFRVWYFWQASLKGDFILRTMHLVLVVGSIAAVVTVLLIIYSAAGNVRAVVDIVDVNRPSENQERCTNNYTGTVVLCILTAVCFLLVLAGLIFGFLTRKVTFLAFNESKILLFSTYNIAFFSTLAVIVINVDVNPSVAYILRSICIIFSVFFTVLILMGNKLWLIKNSKNARSKKSIKTHTSGGGSSSSSKKSRASEAAAANATG